MANLQKTRSRTKRLDQYVIENRPRLSRGFAVRLIESGEVLVNGSPEKPGYKLKQDDVIVINFDESSLDVIPEIDLPILYEDDNVIVVNKPAGVISHARGRYWDEPSVASFIRSKIANAPLEEKAGQPTRAGIVHRLDRATSGVMICAKNTDTLKFLQKQFSDRKVTKTYTAIVAGHMQPEQAIIDMPIGRNPKQPSTFRVDPNGKAAVTRYIVTQETPNYSLLTLTPQTGRTHQLRVHLKQLDHPIVGDVLYGGEEQDRLYLHAESLDILLSEGDMRHFEAPLPTSFKDVMNKE